MKNISKAISILILGLVLTIYGQVTYTPPSQTTSIEPVIPQPYSTYTSEGDISGSEEYLFSANSFYYPLGILGVEQGSSTGISDVGKRVELLGSLGATVVFTNQDEEVLNKAMEQYPHLRVAPDDLTSYPSTTPDITNYHKGGFYTGMTKLCERYPSMWDSDSLDWWLYLADVCTDTITHYSDELKIYGYKPLHGDFNTAMYRSKMHPGLQKMCELLAVKSDKPTIGYSSYWDPMAGTGTTMKTSYGWIPEVRKDLIYNRLTNNDDEGLDIPNNISGGDGDLEKMRKTFDKRRKNLNEKYGYNWWPQINGTSGTPKMRYQSCGMYIAMCQGLRGSKFYWYSYLLDESGKPYIDIEGSNSYLSDTLDMIFGVDRLMTTGDVNYTDGDRFYLDMWYFYDEMKLFGPHLQNATWINDDKNNCGPVKEVVDGSNGNYQVGVFADGDKQYFLIVNRQLGLNDTRTVTIKFEYDGSSEDITVWDIYNSTSQTVSENNGYYYYTISIPSGRARLLKITEATNQIIVNGERPLFDNNGRKIVVDERTGLLYVAVLDKFYNGGPFDRCKISVWVSADHGESWVDEWVVVDDEEAVGYKGQAIALDVLGNPYVIYARQDASPQGLLYCATRGESSVWITNCYDSGEDGQTGDFRVCTQGLAVPYGVQ